MGANSFLVRFAGGWAERLSASSIATYGRIEALLGLGALSSLAEVNRVADGQLDDFKEPRVQTDIQIDPRYPSETPYMGFQVGDTVTVSSVDHRVLGLAVTEDQNGRVVYVPTLNENVVLDPQARVAQALTKMVRGTGGGRFKVAQPVVPSYQPRGRAPEPEADSGCSDDFSGGLGGWTEFSDSGMTPVVFAGGLSADDDGFGYGFGALRHDCDIGSIEHYVQCTVTAVGSDPINESDQVTLYGRMIGTGTPDLSTLGGTGIAEGGYSAEFDFAVGFGATVRLHSHTSLGSGTIATVPGLPDIVPGDVLRLEISGATAPFTIRALINGAQVASTTNSTIPVGQYGGVQVNYNSPGGPTNHAVVIDDFSSGPL